jgi:penicillin amidase
LLSIALFITSSFSRKVSRLVVGAIPVRRNSEGQTASIGWTGQDEWEGFIPAAELPEVVNPPEGFLVAANQDLTPPGYPYRICSPLALPYRAQRLTQRLSSAIDWSRERGEEVQTDTLNPQSEQLLQLLLAQLHDGLRLGPQPKGLSELEKRALLLITGWDGDEQSDSPSALLWQQWYLFLVEGILRPQMGLQLFDQFVATKSAPPVIDRLLTGVAGGQENAWLGLQGEQGLPRVALRSFRRAVALLAAKHGNQPDRWRWGKEHRIWFRHPLSQRFRLMAPFLDLGPYPVGGSDMTLFHNSHSLLEPFAVNFVASYRRVVDMGLPDDAVDISAPGSSGHPFSPNFSDQLQAWLKGGYAPLHMRHSEIRSFPCLLLSPPKEAGR